jgi:2-oxoglutarate dehydrogenase E2 component (dihydrolipoamide succinyltransferase)
MAVEVKVPEVGESITEVYIGTWHKSEGDEVAADESVVEIESEKATFEIPAPSAGVLSKILKQPGETAQVGEVIARIEPAEAKPSSKRGKSAGSEAPPAKKEARPTRATRSADGQAAGAEAVVMPAARRVMVEQGIQPGDVEGTGKGGRITKEDVSRAVARKPVAEPEPKGGELQVPERNEEAVPMSPIRQQIARRLVEAQHTAALLTTFNEVDMSAVMALREQHKESFLKKYDVKLGFMSFFVKATVDALKQFPQVNAEVRDRHIVYHNYYDIGVAIGSGRGLVVPVLRNAERMSFAEIELAINDFARRAEANELRLDELRGGTFTISNGGVYGSLLSTPIVNPPQSGVLGMHTIQERPVVRSGAIVARPMMYIALTYDHRVVDGREAVTFLRRIKEAIEEPARMLIEV